jgi:hypothetical protein
MLYVDYFVKNSVPVTVVDVTACFKNTDILGYEGCCINTITCKKQTKHVNDFRMPICKLHCTVAV